MDQGSKRAADSPNVWGDETDNFFDFDISTVAAKPQESHKPLPRSPVFRYQSLSYRVVFVIFESHSLLLIPPSTYSKLFCIAEQRQLERNTVLARRL